MQLLVPVSYALATCQVKHHGYDCCWLYTHPDTYQLQLLMVVIPRSACCVLLVVKDSCGIS